MKSILIPPIPHLQIAVGRPFHLVLSHLLDNPIYRTFYTIESQNGSKLILDNSAHEKSEGQSIDNLLRQAQDLAAYEVVIPDCLFDSERTQQLTSESLEFISTSYAGDIYRWMVVAQGQNEDQWAECLQYQVRLLNHCMSHKKFASKFSQGVTIGVSKDYEMWEGGLLRLLKKYILPAASKLDAEIHLLGWGRDLWALRQIRAEVGSKIRSIDSAKPFVYGMSTMFLNPNEPPPEYPRRPGDYFTAELSYNQLSATIWNIDVFDRLAIGRENVVT